MDVYVFVLEAGIYVVAGWFNNLEGDKNERGIGPVRKSFGHLPSASSGLIARHWVDLRNYHPEKAKLCSGDPVVKRPSDLMTINDSGAY